MPKKTPSDTAQPAVAAAAKAPAKRAAAKTSAKRTPTKAAKAPAGKRTATKATKAAKPPAPAVEAPAADTAAPAKPMRQKLAAKTPPPAPQIDPAELAVRRYLEFLVDPSSAIDSQRVAELNRQLEAATDIVQRLRLSSELGRAVSGDPGPLAAAFVEHVKQFAADNGIPASSFLSMGVEPDLLTEAKMIPRPPREKAVAAAPQKRRVSSSSISELAAGMSGPFTIQDLASQTGASATSVKRVLEGLVDQGVLAAIGPDPEHSARGRAPARFQTV